MIVIIDYKCGNIASAVNIIKKAGSKAIISSDPKIISKASKLILPGVGSFDCAIQQFNSSGMRELVEQLVVEVGIPILGVCVGMQMLANSSEEGKLPGLGWVDGNVKKFNVTSMLQSQNLPHMGWNNVVSEMEDGLFNDMRGKKRFYFLHSYYFDCFQESNIIGLTDYGFHFTSAIKKNNIFGVQFHPEKSHHYGAQLLKNFSEI